MNSLYDFRWLFSFITVRFEKTEIRRALLSESKVGAYLPNCFS